MYLFLQEKRHLRNTLMNITNWTTKISLMICLAGSSTERSHQTVTDFLWMRLVEAVISSPHNWVGWNDDIVLSVCLSVGMNRCHIVHLHVFSCHWYDIERSLQVRWEHCELVLILTSAWFWSQFRPFHPEITLRNYLHFPDCELGRWIQGNTCSI